MTTLENKTTKNPHGFSASELVQRLANAMKTGAGCGGHTKAAMNDSFARGYRAALEEMGAAIPTNSELYAMGTFNGQGAF